MAFITKDRIKLFGVQLLIFLIVGEIATRILYPLPSKKDTVHYGTLVPDEEVGWLPKANHTFFDSIPDSNGTPYTIDYTSDKLGFRTYGDLSRDSIKKILFIGDSFTQAAEVSDGKPFYNIIQDSIPVEIFAFGSSGFGTLQEFLVFRKQVHLIKPDLIVWQFCTNDFIDNHFELEKRCLYNNQKRRPYLLDGEIAYRNSKEGIYNFLISKSSLIFNIDKLITKKLGDDKDGELNIAKNGKGYPYFKEAFQITDQLLKNIKAEIHQDTKIVAFCADSFEPQFSFIKEVVEQNGIPFIVDNIHRINEAKRDKKTVFCYDNVHWNEAGHKIVGNALLKVIKSDKFLE